MNGINSIGEIMKLMPWIAFAALFTASNASAQSSGGKWPFEEYDTLINQRRTVTALGPELFGDSIDLNSGALSFTTTDVSIPGNNRLSVAVSRKYAVVNRKDVRANDRVFADWDIDIPNLSGMFATTWHDNRCAVTDMSDARPPPVNPRGYPFEPTVYWKGNTADMPGGGDMMLISSTSARPSTGGPYYWITPGRTVFSCLGSINNGPGQGFLGVTPDGIKYWFNHMAQYPEAQYEEYVHAGTEETGFMSYHSITRKKNLLYPTMIEDRFGNRVTYTYSNNYDQPLKIDSIISSDGRSISFQYNARGQIDSISDGSRSWTYVYDYSLAANSGSLTDVVLPDTRRWTIGFAALSRTEIAYLEGSEPGGVWRNCFHLLGPLTSGDSVGTIVHPSGATAAFTAGPVVHGRSNVPLVCRYFIPPQEDPRLDDYNNPNDDVAILPFKWHALSLTRKEVSGLGLSPQIWTFSYTGSASYDLPDGNTIPLCLTENCFAPQCLSDSCAGSRKTTVTAPGGKWKRYTFGNSYRYNEGKLLKVEEGASQDNILKTTDTTYELAQSGRPYPTRIGVSPQPYGDGFVSEYPRPEVARVVTQQTSTFSRAVDADCASAYCLDGFLRSTRVKRFSSLGFTKTDTTTYHDNLNLWILGQVATQSTDGIQASSTDYDANAMPSKTWAFGKLQQTLTYNLTAGGQDGTLASVSDGRDGGSVDTTIHLSNWKRGIPQQIQHPATLDHPAVLQKAEVHDNGWIDWVTDENDYKTCYTYDALGRLTSIVPPSDETAGACDVTQTQWNKSIQTFVKSTAAKYGLPAGHWQQTVTTGLAHNVTYLDALWRPVVEETFDNSSTATANATRSVSVKRYDAAGRLAFQSYPVRTLGSHADPTLTGIRTEYDTLDRVSAVRQDSELGVLSTTTEYLPGFQRRTTDPRGIATTTSFQAFDTPDEGVARQIDAAANTTDAVRTLISRDAFGKPLDVSRGLGE